MDSVGSFNGFAFSTQKPDLSLALPDLQAQRSRRPLTATSRGRVTEKISFFSFPTLAFYNCNYWSRRGGEIERDERKNIGDMAKWGRKEMVRMKGNGTEWKCRQKG